MNQQIIFAHLLNDRSGSPRVLKSVITALPNLDRRNILFVGSGGSGVLESVDVERSFYWYRRGRWRLITLITFLLSQLFLFVRMMRDRRINADATIYVNTLLPFGAALFGWLTGRLVICHVHEVSISPAPLKWFLLWLNRRTSDMNIYVGDAHARALPGRGVPTTILHNPIDPDLETAGAQAAYAHRHDGIFRILMLASLRDYKGVPEFLMLAAGLSHREDLRFDLVLNDSDAAIRRFAEGRRLPRTLNLHASVVDVRPFYSRASVLLNLSRVDQWLETFGLTIVEAMAFGVPVIVPPVGGPAELVGDGQEGYLIDSRNGEQLQSTILRLAADPGLCQSLSKAARTRASAFSTQRFRQKAREILTVCQHMGSGDACSNARSARTEDIS